MKQSSGLGSSTTGHNNTSGYTSGTTTGTGIGGTHGTTTGSGIGGTTSHGTHGTTHGSNTTSTTHDAHNKDSKNDSTVGKLMEKAGNMLHQEGIAEKGRLKREEAARPDGTY
jgi:hypothetical protein